MKTFQILGDGVATGQTKNGGINLGTGIENLGWKLTDLFNVENGLQKNCNCAVVGCPGKCGVPIGHLLLQCDDNRLRRGGTEGELYKQGGGDGVRKISANEGSGWMLGKGFEGVAFDQLKTGFILKLFSQPLDESLVDFKRLDGVANCEKSTGQGSEPGADFLNRLGFGFRQGMGDDGGQGRFRQEILSQLTEGTKSTGGQDFTDLGCVQSYNTAFFSLKQNANGVPFS